MKIAEFVLVLMLFNVVSFVHLFVCWCKDALYYFFMVFESILFNSNQNINCILYLSFPTHRKGTL
jgi:hypothetical protein